MGPTSKRRGKGKGKGGGERGKGKWGKGTGGTPSITNFWLHHYILQQGKGLRVKG